MAASDQSQWQIAAELVRRDLGPNHNPHYGYESANKDLQKLLERHKGDSIKYRSLDKLRPLFEGLKPFTDIVSAVTQADPHGVAPLVWGIFKSLISLAESYLAFFDEIDEFFAESGRSFERLKVYQSLFVNYCNSAIDRLEESLVNVFNEFATFRRLVENFFAKSKSVFDRAKKRLSETSEKQRIKNCIGNIQQCCIIAQDDAQLVAVFVGTKLEETILERVQSIKDAGPELFAAIGNISKDIQQGREIGDSTLQMLKKNGQDVHELLGGFQIQMSNLNAITNQVDRVAATQQIHFEASKRMEATLAHLHEKQMQHAESTDRELGTANLEIHKANQSLDFLRELQESHAAAAGDLKESMHNVENQQQQIYDRQTMQIGASTKMQESIDVLVGKSQRADVNDYLQWLSPVSTTQGNNPIPQGERLEAFLDDKLEDTCQWILADGEPIARWMNPYSSEINSVWLTGDAGFGKTIVTSHILNELNLQQRQKGVAYFFCRRDNPETQQVTAILRTWICQLLQPIGEGKSRSGHFFVPEAREAFEYRKGAPTMSEMCKIARRLFSQKKQTWLVVDGFDECLKPAHGYEHEMTDFFELIRDAPSHWRILLVSRPSPWFLEFMPEDLLEKLSPRAITYADNKRDLDMFIDDSLKNLGKPAKAMGKKPKKFWESHPELRERAAVLFRSKAQGMFLYIQLLKEKLDQATKPSRAAEFMDQPPESLDQLYSFEIERISELDEDAREELWKALRWILCNFRSMRNYELAIAISIETSADDLDVDDLTDQEDLEEELRIHAGSFLILTPEVRFRHASASEFLSTDKGGLSTSNFVVGSMNIHTVHAVLANKCLSYLCFGQRKLVVVDQDRNETISRFRRVLEENPFLEYACFSWIFHASQAASGGLDCLNQMKGMLGKFLGSLDLVLAWIQMFHFLYVDNAPSADRAKSEGQSIFASTESANGQALVLYLRENHPEFMRHFGWAPGNRFTRWDRFLTQTPRQADEWNKYNMKPLYFPEIFIASFFDYEDRVEELLSGGIDINHRGDLDGTALIWAADGEAMGVLGCLLEKGADTEVMFGTDVTVREGGKRWYPDIYAGARWTALYFAVRAPIRADRAESISYPAAEKLLDNGSEANIYGNIRNTHCVNLTAWVGAINHAVDCIGAGKFIVNMLRRNENWRQVCIRDGGPLHLAARTGKTEILKALVGMDELRSSISVEEHRMTPLHMACISRNPPAICVLIDAGADRNKKCSLNGYTPLHISTLAGGNSVELLLERGADVNATDYNGNTILHLAAISYAKISVTLLKKQKGFDINILNKAGKTALQEALESNNVEAANILVEEGADVSRIPCDLQALYDLPITKLHSKLLARRDRRSHRATFEWAYILCKRKCCEYTLPRATGVGNAGEQPLATCQNRSSCNHVSLPYQILAKILRQCEVYEKIETIHHEHLAQNEISTLRLQRRYVTSAPIMGSALQPVHRIEFDVDKVGHWGDWSFNEACRVTRETRTMRFLPDSFFAHYQHTRLWPNPAHIRARHDARHFRPGDSAGMVTRAHYAGWENVHERGRITMWISVLADEYTREQREAVWGVFAPLVDAKGRMQSMYGHGPGKQRAGLEQIRYFEQTKTKRKTIRLCEKEGTGEVKWVEV